MVRSTITFDPQMAADRFLKALQRGSAAAVAMCFVGLAISMMRKDGTPVELEEGITMLVFLTAFVALVRAIRTMYRTRRADEVIEGIWNAGASWAFIITFGYSVLRSILQGILRVASEHVADKALVQSMLNAKAHILLVLLASFFIAAQVARSRSVEDE